MLAMTGSSNDDNVEDPFSISNELFNTVIPSEHSGVQILPCPRRVLVDDEYTHAWASIACGKEDPGAEWMEQYFLNTGYTGLSSPRMKVH